MTRTRGLLLCLALALVAVSAKAGMECVANRGCRSSVVPENTVKVIKPNLTAAFPASIKTIGVVMPASIYPKQHFDAIAAALVAFDSKTLKI